MNIPFEVLELAQEFAEEVGFTFNAGKAHVTLLGYIQNDHGELITHYVEGALAGAALVAYEDAFQDEFCGFLFKFYVRKPYRKTTASRELAQKVVDWFDDKGCVFSEAMVTGGLTTDKLTLNLFKKFGYSEHATILRRFIDERSD